MMRRRGRIRRLIVGTSLALLTFIGTVVFGEELSEVGELYTLAEVSVLVAAGALLAEGLNISAAIVELSLGLIAGFLHVPPNSVVDELGLIGSVFIMFYAGLEVEPSVLRSLLAPALFSGIVSFLSPLLVSYIVLISMGFTHSQAVLAGIGVSTTSVAVVYAIIRRYGLLKRRLGQMILAVAMVADITSILAFVVEGSAHGAGTYIYMASIIIAPFLLERVYAWVTGGEHEADVRLIFAFLVAAALISEYFKVHAILFAFLFGVAMRKHILRNRSLEHKLSALTFGVLAPIFFVSAGLHSAPRNLLLYMEYTILLILTSLPAKILLTNIAMRIAGVRPGLRLTSVFGARLTVSSVIAYMGESLGLLPHDLAGSIILSALLATIISGILAGTAEVISSEEF